MRLRASVLVAAMVAVGVSGAAQAAAPAGLMLVGHGQSADVKISQRVRADGTRVTTELTLQPRGHAATSSLVAAQLSASHPVERTVRRDVGASDLQIVAGAVYENVARLRVLLSDGTTLLAVLRRGPTAVRRKWPALKHVRFFYMSTQKRPGLARLIAIDRHGKSISRISLR